MAVSDSQRLMARRVLGNTTGRLLRRGSKGVTVRALQTFLADQGYDVGKLDGSFGKRTSAALKAFQKANGLGVDGKAGSQTFGKMREMFPSLAEPVANADIASDVPDIDASRRDAVQGLVDQGITDPDEVLNFLNFDDGGAQIGDFTPEEVKSFLPPPTSPTKAFAPEMAAEGLPEASMPGVSSPPVSASQPPLPPTFDDAMFQPAMPNLPEQYGEAERSDGLAGLIDQGKSSMTGTPANIYAAERRMEAPQEWAPSPGDGMDPLRQALLGKISAPQGAPQPQPQMNDLLRALAMAR